MYIKEQINFRMRKDLSIFNERVLETLFIELKNNKKESAIVGVIYRPPNSKMKEFEDELEALLSKITKENKLIYLMGDINMYMDKSVLSMKDKQIPIVLSLLDKRKKGTNLALESGISRLNESYIIIISPCCAIA